MHKISTEEHKHLPIPEIIKGKIFGNLAQKPGTNKCIICGDIIPDTQKVKDLYLHFIRDELGIKTGKEW